MPDTPCARSSAAMRQGRANAGLSLISSPLLSLLPQPPHAQSSVEDLERADNAEGGHRHAKAQEGHRQPGERTQPRSLDRRRRCAWWLWRAYEETRSGSHERGSLAPADGHKPPEMAGDGEEPGLGARARSEG